MSIQDYLDVIKIQWNTDSNGNKISIQIDNEVSKIVNGKITLSQIPDYFYKVQINGMYEKQEGSLQANEFKVNYLNGDVFFHESREAQNITITRYFSRGVLLYPASRIYSKLDVAGNVIQTIQSLIDSGETALEGLEELSLTIANSEQATFNANTAASNANTKAQLAEDMASLANSKADLAQIATDNANIAITNANQRIDEMDNRISDYDVLRPDIIEATDNANTAAINANQSAQNADVKASLANDKAIYAEEQGDYAKNQGDFANEKALLADEKANLAHTKSQIAQDAANNANEIASNLVHLGTYNNDTTYLARNIVDFLGSSYMSLNGSQGILPTDSNYWKLVGKKGDKGATLTPRGVYSNLVNYEIGDLVVFDSGVFNCIQPSIGNDPTDTNYWELFIAGGGDMNRAIYDTNYNGKVDISENSERLGGQLPSYYASKEYVDNLETMVEHGNEWHSEEYETAQGATTKANQAEQSAKDYTDQQITLVTETGIPKLNVYEYKFNNVAIGTTEVVIPLDTFDKSTDTVKLYINTVPRDSDFFIVVDTVRDENGSVLENGKIVLNQSLQKVSKVTIEVWKNIPIGEDGSVSGQVIAIDSMPQNRVIGLETDLNNNAQATSDVNDTLMAHKADNTSAHGINNKSDKVKPQQIIATSGLGTTFSGEVIYSKNQEGLVSMQLDVIRNQDITSATTVFTLPAGFRPPSTISTLIDMRTDEGNGIANSFALVEIFTSGAINITPLTGTTTTNARRVRRAFIVFYAS